MRKEWFVCLCWGLTSQSTIFQSCRDGATTSWVINQYFRGVKYLAQGHNTAAVGFEPPTSRSRVRHSTTEPPLSPRGKNGKNHYLCSKCRSVRSSNLAFVRLTNLTWLIMQSLCLRRPLLISLSSRQRIKNLRLRHPGRPIHASKMFGSTSLTGLNTTPSQNACSAKSVLSRKARTFSQMKVCIFLWC